MSKEIPDRYKNDEIDLIDIIAVLIKRKWIIIGVVVASLVLSGVYVAYFREINYKAEIIIKPPQVYEIEQKGLLIPKNSQMDIFLNIAKKELSSQKRSISNEEREQHYTYTVEVTEKEISVDERIITEITDINIQITGQKEKIAEVIPSLYKPFIDFENKVEGKNRKIFNLTQTSLENSLIQKREMIKSLSLVLNKETLSRLPAGGENAVLYMINTLSSDITEIEITKGLNEELELSKGSFILVGSGANEIVVDHDNLGNLESYITPEKSRKRQLLPVIISVFLAFFVGIFLAFVIEFFSREGVKKRLREIKK